MLHSRHVVHTAANGAGGVKKIRSPYGTLIRFACTYLTNVKLKFHKTQNPSFKTLISIISKIKPTQREHPTFAKKGNSEHQLRTSSEHPGTADPQNFPGWVGWVPEFPAKKVPPTLHLNNNVASANNEDLLT